MAERVVEVGVHLSSEEIDRFAARQLPPSEAAAVRRHLLGCPACRERLRASPFYPEQGRREAEILARLKERSGCPEPAVRVAFAADALPPEQHTTVAGHVRRCRACSADVGDLRSLQASARGRGCLPGFRRR
ncbi:MAG: zf-HC2 domain-containing protein [Chloroflexi bacterium]|nr:zf-HC2 domain-containing protein [Chloroflexota bacterium]